MKGNNENQCCIMIEQKSLASNSGYHNINSVTRRCWIKKGSQKRSMVRHNSRGWLGGEVFRLVWSKQKCNELKCSHRENGETWNNTRQLVKEMYANIMGRGWWTPKKPYTHSDCTCENTFKFANNWCKGLSICRYEYINVTNCRRGLREKKQGIPGKALGITSTVN